MFNQKGFTLVEVTIAILIASVAISGLIYMIGSAAIISTQSKANKEAAQIAASEMERLRNVDFDSIGFPDATGNEPLGTLPRFTTTQTAITSYQISYEITWVDDPNTANETRDYKRVKITVSWQKPRPGKYTLSTYISQASKRVPGRIIVPPPPELVVPPSPSPGSIVRGSVPIMIRVNEPSMLFSAIEVRIGNNLGGHRYMIQPPASSKEYTYFWDTTLLEDGRYEITAYAYEARGGTSFRTWNYIVDNYGPTMPPTLYLNSYTSESATLRWTLIKDGYETVPTYEFRINDYNRSSVSVSTITLTGSELFLSSVSRQFPLNPWGFYSIRVRGFSYNRYSPYSNDVTLKTNIKLQITSDRQGNRVNLTLNWTPKPQNVIVTRFDILMLENNTPSIVATAAPEASSYSLQINRNQLGNIYFKIRAILQSINDTDESDWVLAQ